MKKDDDNRAAVPYEIAHQRIIPIREVLAGVVLAGTQKPRLAFVLAIRRALEDHGAALRMNLSRQVHSCPLESILLVARSFSRGRQIREAVLGRRATILTDRRSAIRPQAERWRPRVAILTDMQSTENTIVDFCVQARNERRRRHVHAVTPHFVYSKIRPTRAYDAVVHVAIAPRPSAEPEDSGFAARVELLDGDVYHKSTSPGC